MVAKVISGKTIRGALSYNENKVREGTASCILASKFGSDPRDLSFHDKLDRFQNLMRWNQKTRTNTLHISLNFDLGEKLTSDTLKAIASTYMDKIGFGDQPYLVYQHFDAAHPHIHILTTNIQANGKRIDIHNIGRNQSEKARKEIEKQFKLVKAESKGKKVNPVQPIDVEKAVYGKSETKRSISNAVRMVARSYKYTSLPEFNAALRQFNVTADRGTEGMQMHARKGLLYSLLDRHGNKIGVPIKASSIYDKPTLAFIEKQFKLNAALRAPHRERLKSAIDGCFSGKASITQAGFHKSLKAQGIYALIRLTSGGDVYGITFVDNNTKVVFNGSDLGKAYGAKAIIQRINDLNYPDSVIARSPKSADNHKSLEIKIGLDEMLKDLTTTSPSDFMSPEVAMKIRRKKRKKGRKL